MLDYKREKFLNALLLNTFPDKIDFESKKQFALTLYDMEVSNFDLFLEFLERCQILASNNCNNFSFNSEKPKSFLLNSKPNEPSKSCFFVNNLTIYYCHKFKQMKLFERIDLKKKNCF